MSYPENEEKKMSNKIKRTVFPFCSCWKYNSYSHDFIYIFKISIRYICAYLCVYSKDHLITCFVYNSLFWILHFICTFFPFVSVQCLFFCGPVDDWFFFSSFSLSLGLAIIHSFIHTFTYSFAHFTLLFIAYSFIFNTLTYISYM